MHADSSDSPVTDTNTAASAPDDPGSAPAAPRCWLLVCGATRPARHTFWDSPHTTPEDRPSALRAASGRTPEGRANEAAAGSDVPGRPARALVPTGYFPRQGALSDSLDDSWKPSGAYVLRLTNSNWKPVSGWAAPSVWGHRPPQLSPTPSCPFLRPATLVSEDHVLGAGREAVPRRCGVISARPPVRDRRGPRPPAGRAQPRARPHSSAGLFTLPDAPCFLRGRAASSKAASGPACSRARRLPDPPACRPDGRRGRGGGTRVPPPASLALAARASPQASTNFRGATARRAASTGGVEMQSSRQHLGRCPSSLTSPRTGAFPLPGRRADVHSSVWPLRLQEEVACFLERRP